MTPKKTKARGGERIPIYHEDPDFMGVFRGHITWEQALESYRDWIANLPGCGDEPNELGPRNKTILTHQWAKWEWHNEDGEKMHRLHWEKVRGFGTFPVTVIECYPKGYSEVGDTDPSDWGA
jgi:hypothetical protein